jgi:2-methylcitrate dehydratase
MRGLGKKGNAVTLPAVARTVAGFDPRGLAPDAVRQAKLLVLDTIGCALAALRDPVAEAAWAVVRHDPGAGVPLIGRPQRSDVVGAVLANGVAIRVADLNDYVVGEQEGQPESAGHPSDNIPVALAIGSARRKSGAEILGAVVLGYELFVRMQNLMDRSGPWDRATPVGLAASAMAGRLVGLDESRLAHAMALGLARAATPALVRTGEISAAKSIVSAMVGQSAVEATLLAEQGVTGPLAILDDPSGLADLFSYGDRGALGTPVPADGGAIMRARVKIYPCVNTGQSAVAAALGLRARLGPDPPSLSRIEIVMADYPVIARHQEDPSRIEPNSREAADHSFPFLVAVSLIDGEFGLAQFAGERWRDPEVMALMKRVSMRRDTSLNARAPGAYPCVLVVHDAAGREWVSEILDPPGFSRFGLDEGVVIAKFDALASSAFGQALRDRVVDAVMDLDRASSAAALDSAIAIEENAS